MTTSNCGAAPKIEDGGGEASGKARAEPNEHPAASFTYELLRAPAETLNDFEALRIATENRIRQLTRAEVDADGVIRGFMLPEDHPLVARQLIALDGIKQLEHDAELTLKRQLRQTPLGAWVKAQPGIGEKQGARLLASIGDPAWNSLHDRPRTLAELRSFCGLRGGTTTQRQRGVQVNWSPEAKTRLWLVAESCMKQKSSGSVYRAAYDAAREKYADAVHDSECRRCGPSGKPAQPGSPLSAGHIHARGLRMVMVTILRELHAASTELPQSSLDSNPMRRTTSGANLPDAKRRTELNESSGVGDQPPSSSDKSACDPKLTFAAARELVGAAS